MRNLTKTLVAASLLTVTNAHSLGIGGIKLHSALNQNLNAEIALATSGENPGDISVKLAPPAKFDEAGVPWSYFLSKINFKTVVKPNGSVVIKLTSNEALKEPFLDFLLEVSWPKGSLYREFTVLVDPPATYKQTVVPVITRDNEAEPAFNTRSSATTNIQPAETSPKVVRVDKFAEPELVSEYGPVRKRDTLWRIAGRVKSDEVTVAQMAMAIYEANPAAFVKPNVNALIKGKTLNIPEPDVALKLSPSEALGQFRRHNKTWRAELNREQQTRKILQAKKEARQRLASEQNNAQPKEPPHAVVGPAKPEELTAPALPEVSKQLTLEPPVEDVITGKTVVVPSDGKSKDVSKASAAALKNQLSEDNKNLEERFERIEQQLAMMQKMLELKDEQLAALQNQKALSKPEISTQGLGTLAPGAVPEVKAPAPVAPTEEDKQVPAEEASQVVLPESTEAPAVVPPAVKPEPPKTSAPVPAQVNQADPYADYYLIAGGIAVSILGALGLLWWRQRKTETGLDTDMFAASSQITLPDEEGDEKLAVALVDDSSPYNVGMVGESAFLSEFTPSEFDTFETNQTEIDPISEADVYLAYGRYQQAEDLMRQAIKEHPQRDDCKLKLLEIFHANENKPAFDTFVQELIKQGKENDRPFWAKVVEMADELGTSSGSAVNQTDPGATLTGEAVKSSAVSALTAADVKPVKNLLEFDLTTFSVDDDLGGADLANFNYAEEPQHPIQIAKSKAESSKKPDLDKDETFQPINSGTDTHAGGFEFDKRLLSGKDDFTKDRSISNSESDFDDTLDFDLDMFSKQQSPAMSDAGKLNVEDDSHDDLEFDLSSFASDEASANEENFNIVDEDDDKGLDFHLSSFTTKKASSDEDSEAIDGLDADSLEFDLSSFTTKNTALNAEADTNELSFDLNSFDTFGESDRQVDFKDSSMPAVTEKALETKKTEGDLNKQNTDVGLEFVDDFEKFDFSGTSDFKDDLALELDIDDEKLLEDYDFSVPGFVSEENSDLSEQASIEHPSDAFNFDSGHSKSEQSAAKKQFNVDDLTDSEGSLETKINLANAYIDMGDVDTARIIADELLQGTVEQQKAAHEILNKIN